VREVLVLVLVTILLLIGCWGGLRRRVQVAQAPSRSLFLAIVLPLFCCRRRSWIVVPTWFLDGGWIFPLGRGRGQAPGQLLVEMAVAQRKSMAALRQVWGLVVRVLGEV
jgi:hypothetical protein